MATGTSLQFNKQTLPFETSGRKEDHSDPLKWSWLLIILDSVALIFQPAGIRSSCWPFLWGRQLLTRIASQLIGWVLYPHFEAFRMQKESSCLLRQTNLTTRYEMVETYNMTINYRTMSLKHGKNVCWSKSFRHFVIKIENTNNRTFLEALIEKQ